MSSEWEHAKKMIEIIMASLSVVWILIEIVQLCHGIYTGNSELISMATKTLGALLLPSIVPQAYNAIAGAPSSNTTN